MTDPRFPTKAEAKKANWFSRRHETPDAHREARENYQQTRGKEARRRRAQERKER